MREKGLFRLNEPMILSRDTADGNSREWELHQSSSKNNLIELFYCGVIIHDNSFGLYLFRPFRYIIFTMRRLCTYRFKLSTAI